VKNIKNSVENRTELNHPEIIKAIREYVWKIQVEETGKEVHVIETSDNPEVVKLIQQQANRAVSEFVKVGNEVCYTAYSITGGI